MDEKIEAMLIDLNGTLHIQDTAIPGAQEALKRLRTSGLKLKFVTNTTETSMSTLHNRLTKLGFDIKREEIFSALTASVKLVQKLELRPYLIVEPDALEDFEGIDTTDPNAVVVGLAPSVSNYKQMDEAFRLMMNGAPLIAMFTTRYYPTTDGLHLGPGAFIRGLEYATDTRAQVVGKPTSSFYLEPVRELGVRPEHTLMVGDDIRDDVEGSMQAGLKGVLVKTGKYRAGDEAKITTPPSFVFDDFPAVVDYVMSRT